MRLGSNLINKIYIGNIPVNSVRKGSSLIFLESLVVTTTAAPTTTTTTTTTTTSTTTSTTTTTAAPFSPLAVMLTSGSSYTVPNGATNMKAWAIGSGGNSERGAGGTAYKTWSVSGGNSISYNVGAAVSNSNYASLGNNTTITYNGITITGYGGGRRANGTTAFVGGEFSGGDGGANGGNPVYYGAGEYSGGAVGGNTLIGAVRFRHQATDIDGLFAVLTLLGINYTLPPTYSFNTNPNIFGAGTYFTKYGDYVSGGIGGGNGFNTSETRETGAVILYFT